MPLYEFYSFDNPSEIESFFFSVKDVPSIGKHVIIDGKDWVRTTSFVFASSDCKIDPFSEKDFVEKTGKKRGTMNDLWETSKELSKKRASILGSDPILEKFHSDYEVKYKQEHPDKKLKKANKKLEKLGVEIKR